MAAIELTGETFDSMYPSVSVAPGRRDLRLVLDQSGKMDRVTGGIAHLVRATDIIRIDSVDEKGPGDVALVTMVKSRDPIDRTRQAIVTLALGGDTTATRDVEVNPLQVVEAMPRLRVGMVVYGEHAGTVSEADLLTRHLTRVHSSNPGWQFDDSFTAAELKALYTGLVHDAARPESDDRYFIGARTARV